MNEGQVQIDISFDPALALLIADFMSVDFSDMKVPLTKIVKDVMVPSIQENFVQGGRPAWRPLSDSTTWVRNPSNGGPQLITPGTRTRKVSGPAFGDNVPLVKSGALMAAATSVDAWTITDQDATAENLGDAPYGAFHQVGTPTIPARPFFVIQPQDEDQAVQIFEDWAFEKVQGIF